MDHTEESDPFQVVGVAYTEPTVYKASMKLERKAPSHAKS